MKYQEFRVNQRERLQTPKEVDDDMFWKTASEHAPETRREISQRSRKNKDRDKQEVVQKKPVSLYTKEGHPRNINQAKVQFSFNDEDPKHFILDIAIYKYFDKTLYCCQCCKYRFNCRHLDTNLIDVDLQPNFVKVLIKGAVFQFVLPDEIFTEKSTAQRSQTTGHLVLKMPRVNFKEDRYKVAVQKLGISCGKLEQQGDKSGKCVHFARQL